MERRYLSRLVPDTCWDVKLTRRGNLVLLTLLTYDFILPKPLQVVLLISYFVSPNSVAIP